jgi:hypothetical protein
MVSGADTAGGAGTTGRGAFLDAASLTLAGKAPLAELGAVEVAVAATISPLDTAPFAPVLATTTACLVA